LKVAAGCAEISGPVYDINFAVERVLVSNS
jgi:hypothetical protein